MENKLRVSEIFPSIQGEGKFAGFPMLFIRLSGCTRACSFCDTKYHTKGDSVDIQEVIDKINKSGQAIVCWTGGEPLLQFKAIKKVIEAVKDKQIIHNIETNGDLLTKEHLKYFDYIACSPKELKTAKKVKELLNKLEEGNFDIKVVTDLDKEGKDLVKYASMLMPLTTYNRKKDLEIQKKVWAYCVENLVRFTPRYQYWIWGKKRKV